MGNMPLDNAGVEIKVDKAVSLDIKASRVTFESGEIISYERLILAIGSIPFIPPIAGIDKEGIYSIEKSLPAIKTLREKAEKARHVVILGGGFIGVEFADELARGSNAEVQLIEMMPKLLETAFDDEFCDQVAAELMEAGVKIYTGRRAMTVNGGDRVESVTLDNGEKLQADMVIIGVGGKPNIALAEKAGLRISDGGSIWVDAYMRTSVKNVFAVGDCALKRDLFTRREIPAWLASVATAEARIAGTNIYDIRVLRQIQGTISAFSTKIGKLSFASAGMSCRTCNKEGFRWVSGTAVAPDRHPGTLPGANQVNIKLVFADKSGILLGGQVSGGPSVGEIINTIALGLQKKVTVREMDMMQVATHPLLTPAPTVHPLTNAAHQALEKMRTTD
jgi:NADPH-dependent 2,4-dienoyl-CoA reductase/sulfur reductase-like enzyme